jgi:transcriptional regulator with XRE-family HTH domain
LWEAISARRVSIGLSQEKVAEILGVSREAVLRMETGGSVPSIVRLAELAEIFECGTEELLTKGSSRQLDQLRHLAALLEGVPQHQRSVLLKTLENLIDGLGLKK